MQLIKAVGMEKATEIANAVGSYPGATRANENFVSTNTGVNAIADRAHDVKNPWTREGWSITRQGQVYKQVGAAKAAELAAEAGVQLGATKPA